MPKKPTTSRHPPDDAPRDDERLDDALIVFEIGIPKAGGMLIDNVSAERIGDTIRAILGELGPTPERALASIVARDLGFYQATAKTRRVIGAVLAEAVAKGDVREVGDHDELVASRQGE